MPSLRTSLIDVRVQGEGASEEIASAIEFLNSLSDIDVIIVARGGGSLQDLWAFNEERLVRAVFASRIPIISGVGHEVDTTLCDLAADVRAPTPTAAAEMVVPHRGELLRFLLQLETRLRDHDRWLGPQMQALDELVMRFDMASAQYLQRKRLEVVAAQSKLKLLHPEKVVALLHANLDQARARLFSVVEKLCGDRAERLRQLEFRLERQAPTSRLSHARERTSQLATRLGRANLVLLAHKKERVQGLELRLKGVNPKAVLDRGYALIHLNGAIVSDSAAIAVDDSIRVTFSRGAVDARVTGKTE